jgi:carboxyl-terminal processing protease
MAEYAISHLYVDSVDETRLVEDAIVGMLSRLDPHSSYSNPEEVRRMNESMQGNFDGIGVQFQMVEDTLLVIQPVSKGPSEKAGILAGDRIVTVNDTAIAGVKMSEDVIMKRLRGVKGSKVHLSIVRRGVNEVLSFTVTRDKIPIHSLDASYMIGLGTGYIRVNRFGATTAKEFAEALEALKKQGLIDLILDLQGNGGGYLNAATDLANEFLADKELIVYTEGRASRRAEYAARGTGQFRLGRLIILVDEYSASASEILTGAVQDWDRGVVVGRRTFGKGLVQRPLDLPDGSMMRLTIARYYTPSGRSIQKPYNDSTGEAGREKYAEELIDRFNRGEMMHADSIHFADSLRYRTLRLGRTVYGGGGIMPDIFVPLDTSRYTPYHRKLLAAGGVVTMTVARYIEQYRKELQRRYKRFDNYKKNFEVDDELLSLLLANAERKKIPFNETEYTRSLPLIKLQLKALIARDLWDMNEYFQIINAADNSVNQALRLLETNDYDRILRVPK